MILPGRCSEGSRVVMFCTRDEPMKLLLLGLLATASCTSCKGKPPQSSAPGDVSAELASSDVASFDDLRGQVPADLFAAVKLIHQAPSVEGYNFDPAALIRAVNGLHPLGKEKVIAAIRAYISLAYKETTRPQYHVDEQRVFLILRLLFVNANGDPNMPWMAIGATSPDVRPGNTDWPLFPLVMTDDIPLCLSGGYSLAGQAQPATSHVDYCEQNCVLRKQPLNPLKSPLLSADTIIQSKPWNRLFPAGRDGAETEFLLRTQALRAVAGITGGLPDESSLNPRLVSQSMAHTAWKKLENDRRMLDVIWTSGAFRATQ